MTTLAFDVFARDKASPVLNKVGGEVDRTSGKMSRFKAAAATGAVVAAAAIVKFGSSSVAAYKDAEAQQRKLTDAYSRFPALADVSVQSLRDLAQAQQNKTKFDGDDVAGSMAVLAQYKLTGTQLKQLTPLMLDYAEKTGKDLPTAAADLGKALLGKGRALTEVGVKFKDAGSVTGNYNQLTAALRSQVGGFAEKEGKSAEGRAEILKNKFGDLQETVGSKLQPALIRLTDAGINMLDWMSENEGKVKAMVIGVGALAAVMAVSTALTTAHGVALAVSAAGGLRAWIMGTKIAAAGQWLLNAAMTANPIGIVIVAIAAMAVGLVVLYKKSETFRKIVNGAFTLVKIAALGLAIAAIGAFQMMANMWMTVVGGIVKGAAIAFGWVPGLGPKLKTAANNMDRFKDNANASLSKVKKDLEVKLATAVAERNASNLKGKMDRIQSKTVTITVRTNMLHSGAEGFNTGGGYARGGRPPVGKVSLVGEEGPELWVPDRPGVVIDAQTTARMLARGGPTDVGTGAAATGPQEVWLNLVLDGRVIQRVLLKLKRQGGVDLGLG